MMRAYSLFATLQSMVSERVDSRKDRGATAVEYGLLVGLIAAIIIGAVVLLGGTLDGIFTDVETTLDSEVNPGG